MQAFSEHSVYQTSKCYVTHGTIGHLDPNQLPIKGKSWTAISSLDSIHKVRPASHRYSSLHTLTSARLIWCCHKRPSTSYRAIFSVGQRLSIGGLS